jgi:ABC-2 type transport system ATP-binding protein
MRRRSRASSRAGQDTEAELPAPPASRAAHPTRPALLELRSVSRSYEGRPALLPLDLSLHCGECVVLIGANGSGKSTLLNIASGRERPTEGDVYFDGRPLREEDPRVRARIAVVGDTLACYPDLTVREHLLLVAVGQGVGDDARAWVDRALADRGLSEHADNRPNALSSGQRQSLMLATAFVRPRDLLLLDEPEQRLDRRAPAALADQLLVEKEDGVAVLMATHQADLARRVADRLVVLDEGKVLPEEHADVILGEAKL